MKDNLDEFLKSATGLQLAYDTLKKSLPTIEKEKKELDKVIEAGIKELKNKITNAMLETDKQYEKHNKEIITKEKNLLAILDLTKEELNKISEKETNTQILLKEIKQERLNVEKILEEIKINIATPQVLPANTEKGVEPQNTTIEESHSAKYFYNKYTGTRKPVVLTKKTWTNKYCFWVEHLDDAKQQAVGKTYKNGRIYKKLVTCPYREKFIMAPEQWITDIINN